MGFMTSNADVSMSIEHTCTVKCIVCDHFSHLQCHFVQGHVESRRSWYLGELRIQEIADLNLRGLLQHWHGKQAGKAILKAKRYHTW